MPGGENEIGKKEYRIYDITEIARTNIYHLLELTF